MPPLFTLTGNLLAERTLEYEAGWQEGGTHRDGRETFQVGGKGLNVAKMLQRLGVPVTALGFVGGATGQECRAWLADHAAYAVRLFESSSPTRTGVVVRAPGRAETTFFAPDRPASREALRQCADFLDTLPPETGVAFCGSFPGWADSAAAELRMALARRAATGNLLVDTYGPPLRELVQWPVRLVKINRREFDELEPPVKNGESLEARLAQALQRWPVAAWVVTDGPEPAWYASREGICCQSPPTVRVVSATGSGDVLFAGIISNWFCGSASLADALTSALPLAAANAASPGVADFPLPDQANCKAALNNPASSRS